MTTARTCSVDGCDRPHHAKGMCKSCHGKAYYAENAEREKANHAAWRAANPERNKAIAAAYRAANWETLAAFKATWNAANRERCAATAAAWYAANRDAVAARSAARYAANAEHDKAIAAAWKATPEGQERVRAYRVRRQALKVGATIVHADIFDRDRWICGVCGLPVRRELAHPDPGSASIDHIVPLSKGGAHSEENAQLAHLICNLSKGRKTPLQILVRDYCADAGIAVPS